LYERAEKAKMQPYLTPSCIQDASAVVTRKADKTGLIAWQSNKYSVPMAYQSARVGVCEQDGQLCISDLSSGEVIAEHSLCLDKGQILKNTHHYRDKSLRVEALEQELQQLLGQPDLALALCAVLKASSPKIYKDQLAGAKQVLAEHLRCHGALPEALWQRLLDTPRLTATGLKERLEAYQRHPERIAPADAKPADSPSSTVLARYGALHGHSNGQGVSHGVY
jgi:hypothetical protein